MMDECFPQKDVETKKRRNERDVERQSYLAGAEKESALTHLQDSLYDAFSPRAPVCI
jgi:hypothetical protein